MKSGRAKIALVAIGGLLVGGVAWVMVVRAPAGPSLSFQLPGYKGTRDGMIIATLNVRNGGRSTVWFYDYIPGKKFTENGEEPLAGFVQANRARSVAAGHTEELHVALPPVALGTQYWHCSVTVFQPSAKERLKAMAMTNRYVAAYYPKTKWLIEKLPWKSGLATNIVSPTFEQVADPDMP